MDITQIATQFAHDKQVGLVIMLIIADFVFGLIAAFKLGTFRLTYFSNFAKNDLLGKVVPWFGVFFLDKASHAAAIVGPVDWSAVDTAVFVAVTGAMAGSIFSSLMDLKLPTGTTTAVEALAGHAPPGPPRP